MTHFFVRVLELQWRLCPSRTTRYSSSTLLPLTCFNSSQTPLRSIWINVYRSLEREVWVKRAGKSMITPEKGLGETKNASKTYQWLSSNPEVWNKVNWGIWRGVEFSGMWIVESLQRDNWITWLSGHEVMTVDDLEDVWMIQLKERWSEVVRTRSRSLERTVEI